MPQEVIDAAGVDAESLRDLGASDQARYFVAWKDDDSLNTGDQRPCLIVVREDDEFSAGCGTQKEDVLVELQSSYLAERSMLVADDADVEGLVEDGWRQITENLLVR